MFRWIPVICLRAILPLVLLTCCIIRPSLMSLMYGLLLLAWPFVPNIDPYGTPTGTKRYLITCVITSCFAICAQLAFHITLFVLSSNVLPECQKFEVALRTVGLQRLDIPNVLQILRIMGPDVAVTVCTIVTAVVSFLYKSDNRNINEPDEVVVNGDLNDRNRRKTNTSDQSPIKYQFGISISRLAEIFPVILLALISVVWPCILSSIYFLTFLIITTWWAIYLPVKRRMFNLLKLGLLFYCAFHMIVLYLFQVQIFQHTLSPNSLMSKLFGLTAFVEITCNYTWSMSFVTNHSWPVYLNPILLFIFYVYSSFQYVLFNQGVSYNSNERFRDGLRKRSYYMACSSANQEQEQSDKHDEEDPFLGTDGEGRRYHFSHTTREISRLFSFESLSAGKLEFGGLEFFLAFIIRHSYVLSLIMMMAWAITYHSWLSFIWLVLACLIWLFMDSRKACLTLSPFIVIYAEALLCLEFIYGIRRNLLPLIEETWPEDLPKIPLQQIGLITPDGPSCIALFLKVCYSLPFWITLRLFLRENFYENRHEPSPMRPYDSFSVVAKQHSLIGNSWFGAILIKYWIYVVGLVLLVVSIRESVVAYSVCYMVFFVVLITVFQISFRVWRIMLFGFWLILIIFSICTLLGVYTYQFHDIPSVWKNWTGWATGENQTVDVLQDLGLVEYDSGSLFLHLLTPISFLIVVILQLKFFHAEFMHITEFDSSSHDVSYNTQNSRTWSCPPFIETLSGYYNVASDIFWRLAELHINKIVPFLLIMLAVYEVCAVNFVLVLFVSIMLQFRSLQTLTSILACCWAAAVVVAKMLYQMNFVSQTTIELNVAENCSIFANQPWHSVDPAKWAGFEKVTNIAFYLKTYILIFITITFQSIVKLRQKYHRLLMTTTSENFSSVSNVLFPNITRRDADESIYKCLQYFANYWFYKFGVETCFIVMVINIGIRMDAAALLYSIWLLILLALPRQTLARLWRSFVLFVAIFLPIQYALCIGLPPSPCMDYPWLSKNETYSTSTEDNLFVWLYLPNYNRSKAPSSLFLIGDFFIFLCASCQLYVFKIELSANAEMFEGGDNSPIEYRRRQKSRDGEMYFNSVPNFITYTKSYLDMVKIFVFCYFHWVTLVIIFVAGFGRISAFAFGYLVAAFCLLWKGNDLYLESFKYVQVRWYALVVYNVFAIFLKVVLQIIGCVYAKTLCNRNPIIIRMFSITCLRTARPTDYPPGSDCYVSAEEAEIFYDGLCFAFLMIQMRIFHSWYFKHTIAEFRAERILSTRGAVLINQLIKKEMKEQHENEAKVLEKLVNKTKKIRETYMKKFRVKKPYEYDTYGEDDINVKSADDLSMMKEQCRSYLANVKPCESNNYYDGKRCGDYYMFDYESDNSENEEDVLELEAKSESTINIDPLGKDKEKLPIGPLQLAHMVLAKDFNLEQTVEQCKEKLRQMSSVDYGPAVIIREAMLNKKISEIEENLEEAETHSKSKWKKLFAAINLVQMFLSSILDNCTVFFNKMSRDCRYVNYVLKSEKRLLMDALTKDLEGETSVRKVKESIFAKDIGRRIRKIPTASDIESVEKRVQQFSMQHNVVVRFFIALYYLLLSRTDLLCYTMMVLDHMSNASVLSLPLPLFAFFWGTLCSPRPPKFFWITVITYTEAMIVIKFIFQFGFFPMQPALNDPSHPNTIMGLDKTHYYVVWDVALLMVLFFHRYILKALGLWKDIKPGDYTISDKDDDKQKWSVGSESELNTVIAKEEEFECNQNSAPVEEEEDEDTQDPNVSILKEADRDSNLDEEVFTELPSSPNPEGRCALCLSFVTFYQRLLHPIYKYVTDMYSLMFLCDIICFLILAFGYSSFGVAAEQGDVVSDIKSNKVPLPFVSMLISLMILIIVDRGIYLRKSVIGKLIFQYMLVIAVHAWIFFALPFVTGRPIRDNGSAQMWYFVKCVYFLLSAWQIKNGYRSRRMGNLLTKRYNLLNYCFFTGFMGAPFLFELRTLIDWIWTETSMPLFDYFSMENIYAAVYRLKCMRKMEKDYPIVRGEPQGSIIKYGMGLPILLLIVIILWLPLLLFALLNAIGVGLVPYEAKFTISVKGYPPLYEMEAHDSFLKTLTDSQFNHLTKTFSDHQSLMFIRDYVPSVTLKAAFQPESLLSWNLSPSARKKLYYELNNSSKDVSLIIKWEFIRPRESSEKEPVSQTSSNLIILKKNDEARQLLAQMIKTNSGSDNSFTLDFAFPSFVEIPSYGQVQPVRPILQTLTNGSDWLQASFSSIKLKKIREVWNDGGIKSSVEFWKIEAIERTKDGLIRTNDNIEMIAFVDKVFPSALDAFTSKGIIGVYVVVVLAAGRFMRSIVVTSPLEVIITEMPSVDKLLQLCLDIFLVREARDFMLELDLFAKLIFLIRSPETLIRWTRPKKE